MKKLCSFLWGLFFVFATTSVAVAQEKSGLMHAPPPVLTITREFVKPGKAGAMHERTESAYVKALNNGKAPAHYVALTSLSGKPRALFLAGYETFAAWEKESSGTSEIDRDFANSKQFADAMGPEGMKKLGELSASAIASSERNIFVISPKMSYMGEDLAKADPEFWGHKSEAAEPKKEKAEPKPKPQTP